MLKLNNLNNLDGTQGHVLTRRSAEILLIAIILVRSTSFVMSKTALNELDTFNLLGIRFTLAFLFMLPFVWHKLKHVPLSTIFHGALIGGALTSVMACEVTSLHTANASTVVFIENTFIVFVPLFEALMNLKLPSLKNIISTVTAMCGVALLSLDTSSDFSELFSLSAGELFALAAAVLYALCIILIDRFSHHDEPLAIGVLQLGFIGLFALIISFIFESPIIPTRLITWQMILTLVIVCSCFGFTLQPLAQSRTTAERVALFWSLSPVGGALAGWFFLGEHVGLWGIIGMGLILFTMLANH